MAAGPADVTRIQAWIGWTLRLRHGPNGGMNTTTSPATPAGSTLAASYPPGALPHGVTRRGWLASVGAAAAGLLTTACNALDPHAENWERIEIGDTRAAVVARMGEPSSTNAVTLPLMTAEKAVWRTPVGKKTYTVVFAFGRVLSKHTTDE